jgi:hypothetical protein
MVRPAARTKTSSLFTLQEATLGPALKEPPRSSQSLHCGPLADNAGDGTANGSLDEPGSGVLARAVGRTIKKRPVPASNNTTLAKITGSKGHRRRVLIMWGSTTMHTIPQTTDLSAFQRVIKPTEMITTSSLRDDLVEQDDHNSITSR